MEQMISNFCILDGCCPELANIGRRAEQYIFDDPDASALKIARFIERLTSIILEANNYSIADQNAPLMEKISILLQDQLITPEIERIMQKMRKVRNETSHAKRDFFTHECDRYLKDIYKLAVWFVNVYVDPAFVANEYIPMSGQARILVQPVVQPEIAGLLEEKPKEDRNCSASHNMNEDIPSEIDTVIIIDKKITKEEHILRNQEVSYGLFGFMLEGAQKDVVNLPLIGHNVVKGVAGSGKTYCALKRAERVAYEKKGKVLFWHLTGLF